MGCAATRSISDSVECGSVAVESISLVEDVRNPALKVLPLTFSYVQ